jgi:hypothetical protein
MTRLLLRGTDPRDCLAEPEKGQEVLDQRNQVLEADGLAITIVNGKPQVTIRQFAGAVVSAFVQKSLYSTLTRCS